MFGNVLDTVFGGGEGGAAEAQKGAAEKAKALFDPYYKGGVEDFGKFREVNNQLGQDLSKYGTGSSWMWDQMNKDPKKFYEELMSGYNETPMAQYERQQMQDELGSAASASGMLGGNAYFDNIANMTKDITGRDQDRYLNNIFGTNNQQMNYLNDFRGQQNNYRSGLMGTANMGLNAAGSMAQQENNIGQAEANASRANSNQWTQMIGAGLGMGRMAMTGGMF